MTDNRIVELFEDFYNNTDNVNTSSSVIIDYQDLNSFNKDLAEDLLKSPTMIMQSAEEAAGKNVLFKNVESEKLKISELRESDLNRIIELEGIVSQSTRVIPKVSVAQFVCRDGHNTRVKQDLKTELDYPRECSDPECSYNRETQFELIPRKSDKISFQKIVLQEPHDTVESGDTPESIDVYVKDALAGVVTAGDRIRVTGAYRSASQEGSSILKTYIECLDINKDEDSFTEINITDEDVKKIKQFAEKDTVYDDIINSVAPTIQGLTNEKEAIAYQLFRGVRKTNASSNIRGDIHILLVGDPSVGKSQILNYVADVAPNSVISSGKSASEAGITVAAVRSKDIKGDEQWTLKAGSMVLADEGVACIDELDKMKDNDRDAMHEALEQQTISVAKAGINTTLKSRCALLGAANPKQGRWNEFDPIQDQIDLDPPLISRFDLIFAPKDNRDKEEDMELSEHIIKTNKYAEQLESEGESTVESEDIEPTIPPELLKKYIAYARSNYRPVLTEEAEDTIKSFFVGIRDEASEEGNMPITARKIEGLIRVSEAAARIQLSDTIEEHHAERAVNIVKQSLKDVGYDEETGEFDIDKIETGETKSQRDRVRDILEMVREFEDDGDKGAPKDKVIDELVEKGYEEDKLLYAIRKETGKSNGQLYEPVQGELAEI